MNGGTTAEVNEYLNAHGLDKSNKNHRYLASKHLKEIQVQRWVEVKQNREVIDLRGKYLVKGLATKYTFKKLEAKGSSA